MYNNHNSTCATPARPLHPLPSLVLNAPFTQIARQLAFPILTKRTHQTLALHPQPRFPRETKPTNPPQPIPQISPPFLMFHVFMFHLYVRKCPRMSGFVIKSPRRIAHVKLPAA